MSTPVKGAPINRRAFLRATAAGAAGAFVSTPAFARVVAPHIFTAQSLRGIPGPFRGRVIEVHHPGSVRNEQVQGGPVHEMVARGMRELFGARDATVAWRRLFEPGDVVGIKVNVVGAPLAMSSFALIDAVVAGLRSAGVKRRDIVVFDRYRDQLRKAGYPEHLPDGVRWDAATEKWDPAQLDIAGYDPGVYREIQLVDGHEQDPKDERTRRSHVCLIVTRQVNKIINLPVLKDHRVAGVTLALKNMSHGFVNNVKRTHASPATIACNTFIPSIVSLPVIRSKVVLHILDATRAIFDRGPEGTPATTWNHHRLYLATDPVALDRIGWEAVDAKRHSMGLPAVAETRVRVPGQPSQPTDSYRQPQHIALASAMGLGVFDSAHLEHRRITLGGGSASPPVTQGHKS